MIRGFFRLIGLLLLAGGFVFLVYDGARSIAEHASFRGLACFASIA